MIPAVLPIDTRPLKRLAGLRVSNVDKKSSDDERPVRLCNYTDVYYSDTITDAIDFMTATASPAEISKFRLRIGDVLITKDSEDYRDIGIPAFVATEAPDLVCGYHVAMLRPAEGAVHPRFLFWAMASRFVAYQLSAAATGLTRFGLRLDSIGTASVPSPPMRVQRAIANFLDQETERIDRLVEKKRRLIDLLEEKRTALITHTVTKGLDPTVPMKDSGFEWIGELPTHWEVKPLMRLVPDDRKIMYGIVLPGPDVADGVPIIKSGDVKPGRLDPGRLDRTTYEIESKYVRSRVQPGDIVYSIRGSVGAAEVVPPQLPWANLTQDAARVAPHPDVDRTWLLQTLRCPQLFGQLEAGMWGAAVKGINIRDLKRLRIPTPPRSEQAEIGRYLSERTGTIDRLESLIATQIGKLNEYRQALITASVTGQIDIAAERKDPEEVVA